VVAAIVTCGGLCPGLNNVVKSVAETLLKAYGVKKVWGVTFGYKGFLDHPFIELTEDSVKLIHKRGGTILGSSRGNDPSKEENMQKIMDRLVKEGVNQVYVVGGDGTHRGANAISREAAKRKYAMSVCGVPKTIDNDVAFIDKSFGFDTAVAEARKVIDCALIEANDSFNGVGIVKLMGREAGFVALYATMASSDVDICLIPEAPFSVDKLCKVIGDRIDEKGHCLIVVAEGAGSEHFAGVDLGTDPSGNKRLPDVGLWLKETTKNWWKEKGRHIEVRLIDPSYQVRSVPAIASDAIYCSNLGSNAVHGAMSGYTGFSSGRVNQRYVLLPIDDMCDPNIKVRVDPKSRIYNRLTVHTGQPDLSP
jgi:6-phosphofructokinase 1